MAELAIKGHTTRGKEVIEILEMLGGKNVYFNGSGYKRAYFIRTDAYIDIFQVDLSKTYQVFTLEEFLEKFPYKVGDKAFAFDNKCTVIGAVWDGSVEEVVYTISLDTSGYTTTKLSNQLQPYEEENFGECIEKTIQECLFGKNETTEEKPFECIDFVKYPPNTDKFEIILGNYEIIQENGKCYVVKKQLKYPKTYEECCKVMGITICAFTIDVPLHYSPLLVYFTKLLICRDAYWKIAGQEMGLGKPWEPNWNKDNFQYAISCRRDKIIKDTIMAKNSILAFPTEEMRDAFYENFKGLIEECKKFL